MASQALLFAETIAGMKKAIKRRTNDYETDSDDAGEPITNRGNKLRKRAKFIHEGQLAPPNGLDIYRRTILHAGYRRDVISRNPPLVDEDGYEIDSEDDEERREDAIAAAAEFDPYADIRIEQLLAPLTAASDLPNHPTLSHPFYSKQLTELTNHARNMVQKENNALWRMRQLLTRLSGDHTWVPCEMLEAEGDLDLITEGKHQSKDYRDKEQRDSGASTNGGPTSQGAEKNDAGDVAMIDTPAGEPSSQEKQDATDKSSDKTITNGEEGPAVSDVSSGIVKQELASDVAEADKAGDKGSKDSEQEEGEAEPPARMRTRAQAQLSSERASTPDSLDELFVHPYFIAPRSAHPDRDFGLPLQEADELRRLVQLYIQKQEEVCRGVSTLHQNLLKADRMRKQVLKWSKAEAHVGELSDGEDWYDKEEWGLDADLKKGHDEDEEETTTTTQKKTRNRRQ